MYAPLFHVPHCWLSADVAAKQAVTLMKLPAAPVSSLLIVSAALHIAVAAVLAYLPAPDQPDRAAELYIRLAAPQEIPKPPMIIMAALPEPPAPEPTPGPAPPDTPTVDEQTLRELAEERDQLRAELQ